jgi:hypothetical protein
MIQRCTNPKHKAYQRYGGRGITICKEWLPKVEHKQHSNGLMKAEYIADLINMDLVRKFLAEKGYQNRLGDTFYFKGVVLRLLARRRRASTYVDMFIS